MRRRFKGQRTARIFIRTVHIGAAVLYMHAVMSGDAGETAARLLGLSGLTLMADQVYRDGLANFRYLTGASVLAKGALLAVGLMHPPFMLHALWACLVLGSLVSHAPGVIRHWPLWGEPGPCGRVGPCGAEGSSPRTAGS